MVSVAKSSVRQFCVSLSSLASVILAFVTEPGSTVSSSTVSIVGVGESVKGHAVPVGIAMLLFFVLRMEEGEASFVAAVALLCYGREGTCMFALTVFMVLLLVLMGYMFGRNPTLFLRLLGQCERDTTFLIYAQLDNSF